MIVERFGSSDAKEIEDLPANYIGCIYCYAASKTCNFYREGDTHFIRVEGELRQVICTKKETGQLALSCKRTTEERAKKLIAEFTAYN